MASQNIRSNMELLTNGKTVSSHKAGAGMGVSEPVKQEMQSRSRTILEG